MRTALVLTLLLGAAPALADDTPPSPAPEPAKTRPPLKLRLDEAAPVAPRITFTPREGAEKAPADVLPALGGRTSSVFEQRAAPGTKGSPYPADTNPNQ
ncbi:MAG TPA: hypothetical protein VE756_14055 [Burkholderiales bacterium]|jgi:hypothetical protein|nr:hypothetical protein [Burkholderiales bacterium]